MPYVTGSAILTQRGIASPTAEQTAWAATCAAAVEGAIADWLGTTTPATEQTAMLNYAALVDGAAAYAAKEAPHGILSVGPDGDAVRLGAGILRACLPVLRRIVPPGIA